jgi:hypothetical protein
MAGKIPVSIKATAKERDKALQQNALRLKKIAEKDKLLDNKETQLTKASKSLGKRDEVHKLKLSKRTYNWQPKTRKSSRSARILKKDSRNGRRKFRWAMIKFLHWRRKS